VPSSYERANLFDYRIDYIGKLRIINMIRIKARPVRSAYRAPVGADNPVTSCDLRIFTDQAGWSC